MLVFCKSLKSFFSSYSAFFLGCPFCLPFQKSIFLCILSIKPFFESIIIVGFFYFSYSCLFLMLACFFETNFPNIPWSNPGCFHFWQVLFFLQLFCFCFHGVCFCLSVSMLVLFWVVSLLCFSSCFLLCFQSAKYGFPCNSGVFK